MCRSCSRKHDSIHDKPDAGRTERAHRVVGRVDRGHQKLGQPLVFALVKRPIERVVPNLAVVRLENLVERVRLRPVEALPGDLARHVFQRRGLEQQQPAVRGVGHDPNMADAPKRNPIGADVDEPR